MLKPDNSPRISVLLADEATSRGPAVGSFDPLSGWSDGVSLEKSHFCLLIKPQIVLRSSTSDSSVCLLAATQASAQVFALMDQTNADDPVSGKIMTRQVDILCCQLYGADIFPEAIPPCQVCRCSPLPLLVRTRNVFHSKFSLIFDVRVKISIAWFRKRMLHSDTINSTASG
jgi:hypothetical protein